MKYIIIVFALLFGFTSCNKKNNKKLDVIDTVSDSLVVAQRITNSIGVLLSEDARLEVATWKEYQKVALLMTELYNTSKTDALENSEMYANHIQFMKDSIRVKELDNPKIVSRLNVLLNQSLRLKDMSDIPSISDNEVKEEVVKLCASFSSLNSKINTFYKTKQLEKDLEGLDF